MKAKKTKLALWICAIVVLLVASILVPSVQKTETIQVTMRDAVLHETNRISLFGIKGVNPALISAMVVSGILLVFAVIVRIFVIPRFKMVPGKFQMLLEQAVDLFDGMAKSNSPGRSGFLGAYILLVFAVIVRIFVIPRFKMVPGKFQMLLEQAVDLFDGMAKSNSPGRSGFLGAYIFTAGAYIFIGTLFELFGIQAITTEGSPITLPAPLSDVNAAIAMGCFSYLVILGGGIAYNGFKGVGSTLKEFSLPISMSFRLFGALLSGLLVTELVYYYVNLSFVLPVIVGVMFTLLHALIQAYVLTMLVALYFGEVSEKQEPKKKKVKAKAEN